MPSDHLPLEEKALLVWRSARRARMYLRDESDRSKQVLAFGVALGNIPPGYGTQALHRIARDAAADIKRGLGIHDEHFADRPVA